MIESPASAIERALVSDRLDRLDGRLDRLEGFARSSDGHLVRLVELAEARERREETQQNWEREQAAQRGTWLRSLIGPDAVRQLVTAVVTALATATAMWGGGLVGTGVVQQDRPTASALPSSSALGPEPSRTDGDL